ncbi:MAG: hypothetical protein PHV61_09540 [Limnochordia bacterium]|jgi:hypothetical protein|nr:hypothetical protein [Limnochordia bacterium]MDD2630383.1 hypothetical protein [Limnochordia bacterium]MDD4518705.1 hypothetical protein [Limnochordia bacterium]
MYLEQETDAQNVKLDGIMVYHGGWTMLFFPTYYGVRKITADQNDGDVEYLIAGDWHRCPGQVRTDSEVTFPTQHTMGIRVRDTKILAAYGHSLPTPYLNSLGVEISNLAWEDMCKRGRSPIAETYYMIDWINAYYRREGAGFIQFTLPVVARRQEPTDPEKPMEYLAHAGDHDLYNCHIYISQDVGGYFAPNKRPRIGCNYDTDYETKKWHYVPWASLQRRAMAHELGHFRGVQDHYTSVISADKNPITQESYEPSTGKSAMMRSHYVDDMFISDYTRQLLWSKSTLTVPLSEHYIWKEVPKTNWIQVVDSEGTPLPNTQVQVYICNFWENPQVPTNPSLQGNTDDSGRFLFAYRHDEEDLSITFNVLLVTVQHQNTQASSWIELFALNQAAWDGKTEYVHLVSL